MLLIRLLWRIFLEKLIGAVLPSLGGFEALIRGLSVITYGLPFYAGWGLTEDKIKTHECLKEELAS